MEPTIDEIEAEIEKLKGEIKNENEYKKEDEVALTSPLGEWFDSKYVKWIGIGAAVIAAVIILFLIVCVTCCRKKAWKKERDDTIKDIEAMVEEENKTKIEHDGTQLYDRRDDS